MDNFDEETLNSYIQKSKKQMMFKIDSFRLSNAEDMKTHSDLLCMVVNYSPKLSGFNINKKIQIKKQEQEQKRESNIPRQFSRTLQLESHNDDDSSDLNITRNSRISLKRESSNRKSQHAKQGSKGGLTQEEEKHLIVQELLSNIITNAIANIDVKQISLISKKSSNKITETELIEEKKIEDEESEDEDDIINRRNQALLMKAAAKTGSSVNVKTQSQSIVGSTKKIKLFDVKIRVYLFKSPEFIDISVFVDDCVADLKAKVVNHLEENPLLKSKLKVKYLTADAYEVRMIEDDDDPTPNMDWPAIEDKLNLIKSGHRKLAIIEKKSYDPSEETRKKLLIGPHVRQNETKICLRVFFKFEGFGDNTVLEEAEDKTLFNVLERINNKSKLNIKNLEFYYFTEHKEGGAASEENQEDLDNEINTDTQLKFLTVYELDLHLKKFPDAPESKTISFVPSYTLHGLTGASHYEKNLVTKKNEDDNGKEYIFNDKNAGLYQEYEVVKVNKYKVRQERILGIDLYNLYNNMPEANKKPGTSFFTFSNETKKPVTKIRDIVKVGYLTKLSFFLEIRQADNKLKTKQNTYEVRNINTRNEIVAKITYLLKMYENNLLRDGEFD